MKKERACCPCCGRIFGVQPPRGGDGSADVFPRHNERINALGPRWSLALQSLTPGGSEYVDDPERCVSYIRETRDCQHQTIVRKVREIQRQATLIEKFRDLLARGKSCTDELCDDSAHERTRQLRVALAEYDRETKGVAK